eukprot:1082847-Prorocentrum_minimum.AAC.3
MAPCCSTRAPPHNGRDFVEWLQQLVYPLINLSMLILCGTGQQFRKTSQPRPSISSPPRGPAQA